MRLLLLVLLAGCGRFAFESTTDASDGPAPDAKPCMAIGHDEDGDTIDDACDVCPHVPDATQRDADRDGVGDACDPTTANETTAFFDPLIEDRAEWNFVGASHSYADDSLTLDTRTDYYFMARAATAANDYFELRGTIVSVGDTSAQITLSFYVGGRPHYYCELFGGPGSSKVAMTYSFDDMTFMSPSETPLPGFAPGPFILAADHRSPNLVCSGGGATASAAIPAGFMSPPDRVAVQIKGLELRLDYYVHIQTN